jgi:hypothetical protein
VIVESQHPKPLVPQKYLSTRVPPLLRVVKMLSAIHLDDYFGRVANKIDDVWPDRRLPPKPNAVQSMGADQAPNNSFGVARLRPQ